MAIWTPFPHAGECPFDAYGVKKNWSRLHRGDVEPLPGNARVLEAWALLHSGEFQRATRAGLKAGGDGVTVANMATCIYATYLETKEKPRLDLYMDVADRAQAQTSEDPSLVNAWYWQAYALAHYSEGISVAKALAQGLGRKVKLALETVIRLQPAHADAHIALGSFHAEVINKVGTLIGGMTYGARKDTALSLFKEGLATHPGSVIGKVEYANALVMLEGDKGMDEATDLYRKAASARPLDAVQWLEVDLAKAELED